jgi:hypothetical protein
MIYFYWFTKIGRSVLHKIDSNRDKESICFAKNDYYYFSWVARRFKSDMFTK